MAVLNNMPKLSLDKELGEPRLSYMLQQVSTDYQCIFSHHTHKPTNINGFFLSLSNVPTIVVKKTLQYYKSRTSNYVIPQEIILTVYLT